jgi:hypothetical protein
LRVRLQYRVEKRDRFSSDAGQTADVGHIKNTFTRVARQSANASITVRSWLLSPLLYAHARSPV